MHTCMHANTCIYIHSNKYTYTQAGLDTNLLELPARPPRERMKHNGRKGDLVLHGVNFG